ncbi:hypothetical protein [uncultured Sunxiuqinia sp.]|uniref:hypothetical protein n=1 Tax=uncultured Sunxiuqinia sp. TaxID=1573825 RepID=UPI002AA8C23B|nr:hypothetical protein [uncultured Sunxiuqinia sp.]
MSVNKRIGLFLTIFFISESKIVVAQNKIEAYDIQQKVDMMNQFNRQQPWNPEKLVKEVMD